MTWNIPNILTVFRLLAAPGVAIAFLLFPHPFADWVALCLFVGASVTDWFDGYLARKWNQQSRFGAMLDPIADKVMVAIALLVITGLYGMSFAVMLPAALILFREVFVSGLREFLGNQAGLLQVTKLAKWKTTTQMVAIAVLLSQGIFEHYVGMLSFGMDAAMVDDVLAGRQEDVHGLIWKHSAMVATLYAGVGLLWIAAVLTLITGWDYFAKSLPYLREGDDE
ncbi:CDP-diacylglycerol--glycerol-3-phosphate 3-phosphatidyltransferase [Actibacterium lipolyticum]|uniref:CDP-diacylglycerol--glycerol-3-phosphate 3-phosphatidyltransferase n=1 Tax=Actibacterium lipolyticum TaxID=1524263 RepID=A0A238KT61_9RHOB|nr:CDP-diacylglycerol--glycerol-3-phosphate 3-phosphatidyltransferase [Actibacterium lipolyticum]SMX45860.1 CDP-diacylglycerol--glycerol-3-phosphate 3-phosphatidyltransferase [Actibacterium lipolyticum]